MKTLQVRWQRLVDETGRTCDRCGATEEAVLDAVARLTVSLRKLDVDVVLETRMLSPSRFSEDPLQSNRIWIAGAPLEEWLRATSGKSPCCSACGDSECRTVTVDGKTYEGIPAELIVKAGLLAAGRLMEREGHGEPASDSVNSREALAIRELDRQWLNAFIEKDIEEAMGFFAPDAVLMPAHAPSIVGREAIRVWYQSWLPDPAVRSTFAPDEVEVAASGDLAYDRGRFEFTMETPEGRVRDIGKYVIVWKRMDGGWKAILDISNSDFVRPEIDPCDVDEEAGA